ncbi:MAG: YkgJ family cysteine cluster protein [Thermoguttaceae bacterium]
MDEAIVTQADTAMAGPADLDERLRRMVADVEDNQQVEAIAQMVEQALLGDHLNGRIQQAFGSLSTVLRGHDATLAAVQGEIRDLIMDVALVKRALASLGQVGVMERRRIEKELVLELFPPRQARPGTGAVTACPPPSEAKVDCRDRLPLCKAACCRIFNVLLTPEEVEAGQHEWNPRAPYSLPKNRLGCVHLRQADWSCSVYDRRPGSCFGYDCTKDGRIWADFEKKVINPDLKRELDKLQSGPAGGPPEGEASAVAAHGRGPQPPVSPPDFSELRNSPVPEPERIFVPPRPADGDGEAQQTAQAPKT